MNKLSSLLNWLGNTIGANPSTLTTTSKTLVGAINEVNKGVPIGSVEMYAGPSTTAPSGWIFCKGQAVSRQTYGKLFDVIGTTYGAGDGVNTFNLPNMMDRMPIGTGNLYSLNASGGSKDAIVPYHNHSVNAVTSGGMSANESHTHNFTNYIDITPPGGSTRVPTAYGASQNISGTSIKSTSVAHTHSVPQHNTNYAGTSGHTTNANLPPYRGLNFIIFAGV